MPMGSGRSGVWSLRRKSNLLIGRAVSRRWVNTRGGLFVNRLPNCDETLRTSLEVVYCVDTFGTVGTVGTGCSVVIADPPAGFACDSESCDG